jgi:hypothetical protein
LHLEEIERLTVPQLAYYLGCLKRKAQAVRSAEDDPNDPLTTAAEAAVLNPAFEGGF